MSVFRVEKTRDFTVMSNHHLRNPHLSLKAKGLMSLMLSLPEDWDYTTKGLAYTVSACLKKIDPINKKIIHFGSDNIEDKRVKPIEIPIDRVFSLQDQLSE